MDLGKLRKEYTQEGLRRAMLAENPFEQFKHWFKQAKAANIDEPNAFCLATVDENQQPSTRFVLAKGFCACEVRVRDSLLMCACM